MRLEDHRHLKFIRPLFSRPGAGTRALPRWGGATFSWQLSRPCTANHHTRQSDRDFGIVVHTLLRTYVPPRSDYCGLAPPPRAVCRQIVSHHPQESGLVREERLPGSGGHPVRVSAPAPSRIQVPRAPSQEHTEQRLGDLGAG